MIHHIICFENNQLIIVIWFFLSNDSILIKIYLACGSCSVIKYKFSILTALINRKNIESKTKSMKKKQKPN